MQVAVQSVRVLLPLLAVVSSAPSHLPSGHDSQLLHHYYPASQYVLGPRTVTHNAYDIPPQQRPPLLRPYLYAPSAYNDLHAAGGAHAVRAAILSPGFRPPTNIQFQGERYGSLPDPEGAGEDAAAPASRDVADEEAVDASSAEDDQQQVHRTEPQQIYYQQVQDSTSEYQPSHRSYRYPAHQPPYHHQPDQTSYAREFQPDQQAEAADDTATQPDQEPDTSPEEDDASVGAGVEGHAEEASGADGLSDEEVIQDEALTATQASGSPYSGEENPAADQAQVSTESSSSVSEATAQQHVEGEAASDGPVEASNETPMDEHGGMVPDVDWGYKITSSSTLSSSAGSTNSGSQSEPDENIDISPDEEISNSEIAGLGSGDTSDDANMTENSSDNTDMRENSPDNANMTANTSADPSTKVKEQEPMEPFVYLSFLLDQEGENSQTGQDEDQKQADAIPPSDERYQHNALNAYLPPTHELDMASDPSDMKDADKDQEASPEESKTTTQETPEETASEPSSAEGADEVLDTEEDDGEEAESKGKESETQPTSIPQPTIYYRTPLRRPDLHYNPFFSPPGYSRPVYGYSLPVTTYGIRKTFYREKNDGYRTVETHKQHHSYRQTQQADHSGRQQQESVREPVVTVVRGGGRLQPLYLPRSYRVPTVTGVGEQVGAAATGQRH